MDTPNGISYASSLFPIDGERYLAAVTTGTAGFQWVIYDLQTRQAYAQTLPFEGQDLLYGSSTRDDAERFYVVGRQKKFPRGSKPILLQVRLPN